MSITLVLALEQSYSINEPIQVVIIERHIIPINRDHLMRANSVQVVHCNSTATLDAEDAVLAYLAVALIGTGGAVVVEEAIQTCAVEGESLRIDDAQTPAISIWDAVDSRNRELWVVQRSHVWERQRR